MRLDPFASLAIRCAIVASHVIVVCTRNIYRVVKSKCTMPSINNRRVPPVIASTRLVETVATATTGIILSVSWMKIFDSQWAGIDLYLPLLSHPVLDPHLWNVNSGSLCVFLAHWPFQTRLAEMKRWFSSPYPNNRIFDLWVKLFSKFRPEKNSKILVIISKCIFSRYFLPRFFYF